MDPFLGRAKEAAEILSSIVVAMKESGSGTLAVEGLRKQQVALGLLVLAHMEKAAAALIDMQAADTPYAEPEPQPSYVLQYGERVLERDAALREAAIVRGEVLTLRHALQEAAEANGQPSAVADANKLALCKKLLTELHGACGVFSKDFSGGEAAVKNFCQTVMAVGNSELLTSLLEEL